MHLTNVLITLMYNLQST